MKKNRFSITNCMIMFLAALFVVFMVGSPVLPSIVSADDDPERNELEIIFQKDSDEVSGFVYLVKLYANKLGATTCELVTPKRAYECMKGAQDCEDIDELGITFCQPVDDAFIPTPESYFYDDHKDLTVAEFQTEIATDWILTWDKDLPTQTIATIDFGTINDSDWLPVPKVTLPQNGASNVMPNTEIAWAYDVPTSEAQKDDVEVNLLSKKGELISSGDLPLESTSWTPPSPLAPGLWLAAVLNGNPSVRTVDENGIGEGVSVTGDAWLLQNGDWLACDRWGGSVFTVEPTPEDQSGDSSGSGGCFISTAMR